MDGLLYILGRKMFEAEDYARKHHIPTHNWRYVGIDRLDTIRGLRIPVIHVLANVQLNQQVKDFFRAQNIKLELLPE